MFKTSIKFLRRTAKYVINRQAASSSKCSTISDICMTTLGNGVKIATEETCCPLACVTLFVEAGSRYETANNNGISHFIEHMAFKGFHTFSRLDTELSILLTGAKVAIETQREMQYFSIQCPAESVKNYIDMLTLVVTDIAFNIAEIEEEYHKICLEMNDADNDPKAVLFEYLHATAFQGTPLAQPVIGPSQKMRRFDRLTASTYLFEHYQPYKCLLTTSGNVVHEQILSVANSKLGCIPYDPCFESEAGPCRFTGSQVIYRDDSMPLAHIAIAVEAPGYGSPQYLNMLILKNMVGSWHKSQGRGYNNGHRVARAAAMENACQSYESFYIPYRDVGLWGVYFVSAPMKIDDMLYFIQKQFMYLCAMCTRLDVVMALNATRLEVARRFDGSVNSCLDMGVQLMYTSGRRSNADFQKLLDCEPEVNEIRDMATTYLYDRCPAVAAVGPTEGLPDYTRIRAGMYWLRL